MDNQDQLIRVTLDRPESLPESSLIGEDGSVSIVSGAKEIRVRCRPRDGHALWSERQYASITAVIAIVCSEHGLSPLKHVLFNLPGIDYAEGQIRARAATVMASYSDPGLKTTDDYYRRKRNEFAQL